MAFPMENWQSPCHKAAKEKYVVHKRKLLFLSKCPKLAVQMSTISLLSGSHMLREGKPLQANENQNRLCSLFCWILSCTSLSQWQTLIFLHKRTPKIELIDFIWGGFGYCSRRPTVTLHPLIRWVSHTQQTGNALHFPSITESHRKKMTDRDTS